MKQSVQPSFCGGIWILWRRGGPGGIIYMIRFPLASRNWLWANNLDAQFLVRIQGILELQLSIKNYSLRGPLHLCGMAGLPEMS